MSVLHHLSHVRGSSSGGKDGAGRGVAGEVRAAGDGAGRAGRGWVHMARIWAPGALVLSVSGGLLSCLSSLTQRHQLRISRLLGRIRALGI